MQYQLPPLPALQAFEAAARHENFAAAAEELNLSQSAVSHRVRALERHLGYPLFERLPRGLRLTESGKAYAPSVRKAFDEILGSTLGIFGPRGEGSVTIRAPSSYAAFWVPKVVEKFLASYPDIEVRLITTVWVDKLAMDETDIDFRMGHGHWPGYKAMLLFKDRVVPVCSPHALQDGPGINNLEDLASRSLIHVMGLEDIWHKYFAAGGLRLAAGRHDIRVDSSIAAAEVAAAGKRIALIQKQFLDPYLQADRLTVLLDREMQIDQGLYLLQPETSDRSKPGAILLRDWLAEEFRGQ